MRRRRRGRAAELFPVNVWPPFVDAVVLMLAAFVLLTMLALVAQRRCSSACGTATASSQSLRADKERIERRLRALAPSGTIEVEEGKVILQGEVLFDSGSDQLRPRGAAFLERIGPNLATLLQAEPTQMVLIGGHTDDRALRSDAPFASNWELSTARAVAVTRVLMGAGVPDADGSSPPASAPSTRASPTSTSGAPQEPPHRGAAGAHPLGGLAMSAALAVGRGRRRRPRAWRRPSCGSPRASGRRAAARGAGRRAAVRAFARGPLAGALSRGDARPARHQRRHKLGQLGRALGGQRRTEQGLDVLARGADLAPELLEALRALPLDARNGRRLAIISDLLAAQRLIEARAVGGLRELRQALGPVPRPITANRRRRPRGAATPRT